VIFKISTFKSYLKPRKENKLITLLPPKNVEVDFGRREDFYKKTVIF